MLTIFLSMLDTEEDKDKLTRIYEKYYGTMLSVARGIISDSALAEDAVSDSIMTIIDNLHKINEVSCHKTRAYIVIIVRSRAINLLNKQKRHPEESLDNFELPDNNISVLDELTMKESCDRIIDLIKTLPKSLSDVLYLSVVMEHSNKEVANLLSLSNDVVRKRLSRAKAQLKEKLVQGELNMQKNNYDDKLFDAVLKIAAEEALEQEMEEMPTCEELNEQFKPSPSLDKKIRKIISRRKFKEKASLWRKTAVKIAASFAVIIVLSSGILLSVEATRNYIFNAVIKWQEEYFSIQHNEDNLADIKIYRPMYLPKDFTKVSSTVIGDIIKISYENEKGMIITFKQSPSESSHKLADHEEKLYSDIKINGIEAYLFNATENDKMNTVLWESNGYIFSIASEVESTELILMAESIKK